MTALRRIIPADRKMLLVLAAPVLAIALVFVAGRVGDDSPTEPAAARSKATTTTAAGGSEATVAAASEEAVGADGSGSSGDFDSPGSGGSSGGGSDVSGTGWTDGYSPSYSEEAQAVLGVDATGETTVPPSATTTTIGATTTSVPGATTTVPAETTTTTIAQPPPAVNEAVIGALLPITAVCFAALALGILARRRRREGPVLG